MDVLRVTAVALVACSAAGADPAGSSRRAHPEGWKQLPAIADAVAEAAAADGVTIDSADAWGEPALGCYAVWLELHGGTGDAPALADQVLGGISRAGAPRDAAAKPVRPGGAIATRPTAGAGRAAQAGSARGARAGGVAASEIAISGVVKPVDRTGVLAFTFTRPPYQGRVRAQLGGGRIAAIACFANEREPRACQATCTRLLEEAR